MLEKHLAKDFGEMFKEYQLWIPSDRNSGWPDRGVQISNSKMVWFELKIVRLRYQARSAHISNLTPQQAAWLAKWQRAGGSCFLFIGFENYEGTLINYGILGCGSWDIWLKVPQQPISIDQLLLYTDEKQQIINWFRTFLN